MSIFNPWAEARRLRARLEHLEKDNIRRGAQKDAVIAALQREARDLEVYLRAASLERDTVLIRMKSLHRRDPVTGRLLPKGK